MKNPLKTFDIVFQIPYNIKTEHGVPLCKISHSGKENFKMQRLDEQKIERVRQFIVDYQRQHGKSPSYRTIEKRGIVSGIAAVSRIVLYLERQGLIEKDKTGQIGLPFNLQTGETVIAPIVGTVPCGEPAIALEEIECSFALPADYFGNAEKIILRAKGDSMKDAGIHHGDLLIVEQSPTANNGEIVVAMIDNFGESEATTKRYYQEKNGKIRLRPENSTMKDMLYNAEDIRICGIVVGVMRSYK